MVVAVVLECCIVVIVSMLSMPRAVFLWDASSDAIEADEGSIPAAEANVPPLFFLRRVEPSSRRFTILEVVFLVEARAGGGVSGTAAAAAATEALLLLLPLGGGITVIILLLSLLSTSSAVEECCCDGAAVCFLEDPADFLRANDGAIIMLEALLLSLLFL